MRRDGAFIPGVNSTQKCKGLFCQSRGMAHHFLSPRQSLEILVLQKENLGARKLVQKALGKTLGLVRGVSSHFLNLFWKTMW